jgi:Protein of unknown function (DUF3102)
MVLFRLPPGRLSPAEGRAMSALALPDLAQAIDREHAAAIGSARCAIEHAVECGRLLIQAKAQVAHGEWLPWIEANTTVHPRTAQVYMRLARELPKLSEANANRVAHLTIREAIVAVSQHTASIAALPPQRQHQLIERAEANGERLASARHHVQRDAALADLALAKPAARPVRSGPDRRKRLLKNAAARRVMIAMGPNVAGFYIDDLTRELETGDQFRAKQSEIDELTRAADGLERQAEALRHEAAQKRKNIRSWVASALAEKHGPIQPFIETAEYALDDETFETLCQLPEREAIAALLDSEPVPLRRGYWGDIRHLQFAFPQPATEWTNVGNEHGLLPEVLASLNPTNEAAP